MNGFAPSGAYPSAAANDNVYFLEMVGTTTSTSNGLPITLPQWPAGTTGTLIVWSTQPSNGNTVDGWGSAGGTPPPTGWVEQVNLVGNLATRIYVWTKSMADGDRGTVVQPHWTGASNTVSGAAVVFGESFSEIKTQGGSDSSAPVQARSLAAWTAIAAPSRIINIGVVRGAADGSQVALATPTAGYNRFEQWNTARTGAFQNNGTWFTDYNLATTSVPQYFIDTTQANISYATVSISLVPGTGANNYTQNLTASLSFNGSGFTQFCHNGNFETDTSGWQGVGIGWDASTLTSDGTQFLVGTKSLKSTFPASSLGTSGALYNTKPLEVGRIYRFSGSIYVPTGSPDMRGIVYGFSNFTPVITTKDSWVSFSFDWVCSNSPNAFFGFQNHVSGSYSAGNAFFLDNVKIEDIGSQSKKTSRSLGAGVSFTGSVAKRTSRSLSGALSFTGAVAKRTARALAATLAFVGTFFKAPRKALSAALSFTGGVTKRTSKALAGGLSFVGGVTKRTFRSLAGGLSFTGSLASARQYLVNLAGSLSFSSSSSNYVATVLSDTPVAYWRLGEASGDFADSSGNGRTLIAHGTPGYSQPSLLASDPANTATYFDPTNTYGQLTDSTVAQIANNWTVEAWLRPYGSVWEGEGAAVTSAYDGGTVSYALRTPNSGAGNHQIQTAFYDGSWRTAQSSFELVSGTAYHVVGTYDGSTLSLYIDNGLDAFTSYSSSISTSATDVFVGCRWDNTDINFWGDIDEVAIYNYALSPAQISAHYNAGVTAGLSGLTKRTNRPMSAAVSFTGAIAKRTSRAFSGALSFAGSIVKRTSRAFSAALSFVGSHTPTFIGGGPILKALSGALSFTGSHTKRTGKTNTGAVGFSGNITKRTSRPLSGTLTFTGNLAKRLSRALAATLTFAGSITKQMSRALTAVLTFTGGLVKSTSRSLSAALTFTGGVLKRTTRSLAGALSFSGAVATVKSLNVFLTASLSFVGTQTKRTSKALSGGLSFTGSVARSLSRSLSAALSFTGSIAKQTSRSLSAALSFTGAMAKRTGKSLAGALSFTGSITKQTRKALNAVLSFVGNLNSVLNGGGTAYVKDLFASLSFTGTLNKSFPVRFTAALSFTGAVAKRTTRSLAASLTFAGSLAKRTGKALSGALTFTGSVTRRTARALAAALSFVGTATKQTYRSLAGSVTFTGALAASKTFLRSFTASLTFTGSQSRRVGKSLSGTLSFTGNVVRRTSRALSAALTFTGSVVKRTARSLSGALSFAGSLASSRIFLRAFNATLSFAGTTTKRTSKALSGAVSFTGSVAKRISRALSAAVSFTGQVWRGRSVYFNAALSFTGSITSSIFQTGKEIFGKVASSVGRLARSAVRGRSTATGSRGSSGASGSEGDEGRSSVKKRGGKG